MSLENVWVVAPGPTSALAAGARQLTSQVNALVVGAEEAVPGAA